MKKSRVWIVIALVLIFAAGIVGGIFAERWWIAKKPEFRRSAPTGHYPSMTRWAKDLGLTAEQQDKIKAIFQKNDERIKELRTDYYKHLGEIREQLKKEIDAVLTPGQKEKMEAMIQKQREEWRKANEQRDRRINPRQKPNMKKESNNEKESNLWTSDSGGNRRSHPGLHPS